MLFGGGVYAEKCVCVCTRWSVFGKWFVIWLVNSVSGKWSLCSVLKKKSVLGMVTLSCVELYKYERKLSGLVRVWKLVQIRITHINR